MPIPPSQSHRLRATLSDLFDGHALAGALIVLGSTMAGVGFIAGRQRTPWLGVALVALGLVLDLVLGRRERRAWLGFVASTAQLGIVLTLFQTYQLESVALYELIATIVFFGFIAHHHLGPRFRPAFFLAVSVAASVQILGVHHGALLIGCGLALVGICHLPVRLGVRVAMLLAAGTGLALVRAGWVEAEDLGIVLPILSSMFMFRIVIYLYDTHHGKGAKDLSTRLGYFFMLPNLVLPFFPVVDYATFSRTRYDKPAIEVYQKGLLLMFFGVVHLILYRIDNYYFAMNPEQVTGLPTFLIYIISNFGLYLRISGLFHLIIGMLHMFGFNLPDTHTRYYLSFSFVEFWRRINIYWKDFMQKVVFQPTFMFLKKRNVPYMQGIVISMLVVFFWTWALHAYQWFWLRGFVLLTGPDVLFWGLLAVFLVIQTWRDTHATSRTRAGSGRALLGPRAFKVVRTVAAMLTICILWSLWSAPTLSAWISLMAVAGAWDGGSTSPWGVVGAVGFVGVVLFMVALTMGFTFGLGSTAGPGLAAKKKRKKAQRDLRYHTAIAGSAGALALILIQNPVVYGKLDGDAQRVVLDVRSAKLSARENAAMVQGYYENLTDVRLINSQLWDRHLNKPKDWKQISELDITHHISGWMDFGLKPNAKAQFKGAELATNSWGMRDKEYPQAKPPGTYRIALLGASRAMGSGVEVKETFAWRLEDRLNAAHAGVGYSGYEILNFSVASYEQILRLMVLHDKALSFAPDAALWIAADNDLNLYQFTNKYMRGIEPPYREMKDFILEAGLQPGMEKTEVSRRLELHRDEIVAWTYRSFVETCRAHGVLPIYAMISEPTDAEGVDRRMALATRLAREAGFEILDLSRVYEGQPLPQMWIAEWDHHPNARGHRLVEAALYEALRNNPDIARHMKIADSPEEQP